MVRRPYLASSIVELENIFDENGDRPTVLASLIVELAHRARPRAKNLERKVLRALSEKTPILRKRNVPASPKELLSVKEHRRVSAHLRMKRVEWNSEEQKVALQYAQHHEFLAELIEKRSTK